MVGPVLYLYGRGEPRISRLLVNPAFGRLVDRLMSTPVLLATPDQEQVAEEAVACDLLRRTDGAYRAGPRLVAVPTSAVRAVEEALDHGLVEYVYCVRMALQSLTEAFAATSVSASCDWAGVSHAIIAGMFLDLSVGEKVREAGLVAREHWDTVMWALGSHSARNGFGVQWKGNAHHRCAVAQLWHVHVQRPDLQIPEVTVRALCRLASGDSASVTQKELLFLRHLKLVSGPTSAVRVVVPFFTPGDCQLLFPVLAGHAQRLVGHAVGPMVDQVKPLWHRDTGLAAEATNHLTVRLILENATDRVLAAGLLKAFPYGVPHRSWGRWSWQERQGGPSLIAGAFDDDHAVHG